MLFSDIDYSRISNVGQTSSGGNNFTKHQDLFSTSQHNPVAYPAPPARSCSLDSSLLMLVNVIAPLAPPIPIHSSLPILEVNHTAISGDMGVSYPLLLSSSSGWKSFSITNQLLSQVHKKLGLFMVLP